MTRNPITKEMAKAIDIRDYRNLVAEYYGRWNSPELAKRKARVTVFNKRSIVFDKDFRFTFEVVDTMGDGRYTVWPYKVYDDGEKYLLCEALETEFAESMDEVRDLVVSVLYYINTRI